MSAGLLDWTSFALIGAIVVVIALVMLMLNQKPGAGLRGELGRIVQDVAGSPIPVQRSAPRHSIFVSYRRDDNPVMVDWLCEELGRAFGHDAVFKDTTSIKAGTHFPTVLKERLAGCQVFLCMIGAQWAGLTGADGRRRIHDPQDFVRIEVETALARIPECLVIPVRMLDIQLPEAAILPESLRKLLEQHSPTLRRDADFKSDVGRLVARIAGHIETRGTEQPARSALQP